MNFFARQAEARRLSQRLVLLFILAVIAVVSAVDLVVFTILATLQNGGGLTAPTWAWIEANAGVVLVTTLSVLGVIGLSSLYKSAMLRGGGGVVARSLGGVRVSQDTSDPQLRRLLNVVEEMAIASGVPVPEVYVLEQEEGLNAFAAGHNPSNAAVAVTRGALTRLNRAELQGVVAHEFSHILNGDMRLNVRLMGLLFGLLVLAIIARTVLRVAPRGRSGRKGGGVAVIVLAAAAVLVVGYIGLFFGRMIQAAVSRSREALADASAVQFTRDPSGLRGALIKIGALSSGSRLVNPEGEEVAHMLFAPGMQRLFATHPPLLDRLKAIDPRFDPAEIEQARRKLALEPAEEMDQEPSIGAAAPGVANAAFATPMLTALVGNLTTDGMRAARALCDSLPADIVAASAHPESARGLLLALALDAAPGAREEQRKGVEQQLGRAALHQVDRLQSAVAALAPEQRLPALSRAEPTLRQLTREERLQLLSTLNGMLQGAAQISLHSYALRKLAQVHLREEIDPTARSRSLPLSAVAHDVQVLFSVLAQHGHAAADAARRAYEIGVHHLFPRERPAYAVPQEWARSLDTALSRLDRLPPAAKELLIEALSKSAAHDERLTVGEAELLRTVCAVLHCPLPPLLGVEAQRASRRL